ncbi:MAG: tannase/feruloyl esterase family alpha/beta hydrolase, partial [Rhodospirillaceae bacterium]|nr:tannase/feruloyl esterase family alpha/beta hydrolase [Rhodospirillaceae bacterium]
MMNRIARCFFGSLLFFGQSSGSEAQTINTESCKALAAKSFEYAVGVKVTITKANVVPANGVSQPAHCHILATVAPSNGIEIQLPLSGWNGRMLFTGCGGLCGVIRTDQGSDALARNYAVATSDMGHRLGPGEDPRAWTLNEELVEEWQHRATHTATLLAKAVIATAYGREQDYAYFRGCSTGGRQGLTEALMYPNDYDGVIA